MVRIKDLTLGTSVLVGDGYNKKISSYRISDLTLDHPDYFTCTNEEGKKVSLHFSEYKKSPGHFTEGINFWCFPENKKYLHHLTNVLSPTKKERNFSSKYKNLSHENNKNQVERNLTVQRTYVTKILEQGFVYYKCHGEWNRMDNPKIEFNEKNYYVYTQSGRTKITKIGKTLSLENPQEKPNKQVF